MVSIFMLVMGYIGDGLMGAVKQNRLNCMKPAPLLGCSLKIGSQQVLNNLKQNRFFLNKSNKRHFLFFKCMIYIAFLLLNLFKQCLGDVSAYSKAF